MEINLSKYAGFCEGVGRAYQIVEEAVFDSRIPKPIAVLGSLVHNADVVKKIQQWGVLKVEVENSLEETLSKIKGKVKTLVITAHGAGPRIYELAKEKGFELIDATCPKVIKVQRLAQTFWKKGAQVVIVGEKKHKEVRGINEWACEKGILVENQQDLKNIQLSKDDESVLLSQTTQNSQLVERIGKSLQQEHLKLKIFDTLCLTTHNRQAEIRQLAKKNDAVVVIGSPESSNSNRLWEIAKEENPRSFFIERADQLQKDWFEGCQKIAVSAGASTPDWIIQEVLENLRKS